MSNNDLQKNFELFQRARAPQTRQKNNKKSNGCIACGANQSSLITSDRNGFKVCTKCGVVQEQILINQSPTRGNQNAPGQKAQMPRVVIENDEKIKYLVINFFHRVFPLKDDEKQTGTEVAGLYSRFKTFRAKYFTKGEQKHALKGMHMPTIVLCILYCVLIEQNRAMPMMIMAHIMNLTLEGSRTDITPVTIDKISRYRTSDEIGLWQFLEKKMKKSGCYKHNLKPSIFINLTCNALLHITDHSTKNLIKKLADELRKEYHQLTPPGIIATNVLAFVSNKSVNTNIFGMTKKQLKDSENVILKSKNPKIQEILGALGQ
jgi:transcription initiation factor TFIIIB Brf1 subunit/transcription initiation factor TFIIB